MRVSGRGSLFVLRCFAPILVALVCGSMAWGQGSYEAQVRGTITDQSGALMTGATIRITNDATGIAQTMHTDEHGQYFAVGLRPAVYTVKVENKGFRASEKKNVVLQVDQQTTVDFTLHPLGVSETMEVTTTAPLLDTDSATLGTEITGEYVKEIPLVNRNFFGLTFLSGGVTEAAGSGTTDNYPTGTNFISNGQRNATAEVRLDGALISAPEQGEGGNSNIYYEPVVEAVQEFKVQNNSFSAEFGNNGGTVVNMVLKSGSNAFHGSGWYFMQRSQWDARDFFNPAPNPKPSSKRDQGGISIGGPIKKNKTFFFFDFEKVRSDGAISGVATVPTLAERGLNGGNYDFSNAASGTSTLIYDPKQPLVPCSTGSCRPLVPNNIIPANSPDVDPLGVAILNLYPKPNTTGQGDLLNYLFSGVAHAPDYQFDIKLDHEINDRQHINGRYSRATSDFKTPEIMGDGNLANGAVMNDGIGGSPTRAQNASMEYTWTINPRIIWTSRAALDRVHEAETTNIPTIASFNASLPAGVQGLSSVYQQANGLARMPSFYMSSGGNQGPWDDLFDQCCVNTTFAHTLVSYSSQLVISKGAHLMKLGGEQRIFFNNFWQPPNPTGNFNFTDFTTSPTPNSNTDASGNLTGNAFASLVFGYGDNLNSFPSTPTSLIVFPSVANKSLETGFYFQDDWKVNSKLTVNLGLRYEWSSPYTERHNQIQFSNFTADTGVALDLSGAQAALMNPYGGSQSVNFPSSMELIGTTEFATGGRRTVPTYRKDIGPRLGFAYQLNSKTVLRGGAGIYFGMSPATNFQYTGTAFRKTASIFFTKPSQDFSNLQPYASLSNPFPTGFTGPQGTQYGKLAEWGYGNGNDLGTTAARDADLYMWNVGIQRSLPSQIVLGVDYSANRSTHLPWSGTNNRDFMSSTLLAQISQVVHANYDAANGAGACDSASCVTNFFSNTAVNNPFYAMFTPPCASGPCFNEPDSAYSLPQIPLPSLLVPYPQFTGDFEGLMLEEASSWYNAMQVRFQKRTTHNISFEGSYTVSKLTDNSSAGRNSWVGAVGKASPQQLDRLNLEHSIGANDTPQRLAAAVVVDLPIGRKQWIGGNMNRTVDAVIGGWSVATMLTEQSGQPISFGMNNGRLTNGSQRPNIVCSQLKSGVSMHDVALNWNNPAGQPSFFNPNCLADPGDQIPGNAARYISSVRVAGIHNVDMNLYKSFVPKEGVKIDLRAEIFNLANHARFAAPDSNFGSATFGQVTSSAPGYLPRYFQAGLRVEF